MDVSIPFPPKDQMLFPRFQFLALLIPVAIAHTIFFSESPCAQDAKPVVVSQVIEKEVNSGQRVIGTVHPLRKSTIGSAVDGRVKLFLVDQGDHVTKGQTLAQLRTETLEIEQAAAKAELELAKQRLAELENGSRREDVIEAEANMQGAEAASKNANAKLRRVESLATTNAASKSEVEDAKERADAAKFALIATTALHKRIKDGARFEILAQSKAQVDLQTQRLKLITDRISKYTITSPFDGFISAEFTEVGSWIKQGDPIVEVIQMNEVEVHAPVTAEIAVNLKKGSVIRVEFPELPNELFTGLIDQIVPATATRSRTYPIHIKLKNKMVDKTPMLLAGMLARVDFPAGQRQVLPLVPKDALVLNGNRRSVFVVVSEGGKDTVRQVNVELGVALNDQIQVRGDLKVGDRVVVVGNERLTPDAAVKVIKELKPTEEMDQ